MKRLYESGLIASPVGKRESVVFAREGLREAERCVRKLIARACEPESDRRKDVY